MDMYRAHSMVAITWMLFAGTVYGQSTPSHADETSIRDLVQKYVDARNGRDAEKTRSLFTADADQLVSTGEWRKGIDAVVQGAMASSRKETGKSSIQVEAVRFLGPDIAIVEGRYETSTVGTGTSRKMWTTLIVKRTELGWRITAIRNMLPAPTVPK
jgi:uncharacterized protein (TIGR02246 family)